jgi:hypothetical protein
MLWEELLHMRKYKKHISSEYIMIISFIYLIIHGTCNAVHSSSHIIDLWLRRTG